MKTSFLLCHRFFVADALAARMPELRVIHLEEDLK
jgi:uncharacterized protein (DUF488 family)